MFTENERCASSRCPLRGEHPFDQAAPQLRAGRQDSGDFPFPAPSLLWDSLVFQNSLRLSRDVAFHSRHSTPLLSTETVQRLLKSWGGAPRIPWVEKPWSTLHQHEATVKGNCQHESRLETLSFRLAEVCEDTVPEGLEVEILDFDNFEQDAASEMAGWPEELKRYWLVHHPAWGRCGLHCPCRNAEA
jgi:hypothetical protein